MLFLRRSLTGVLMMALTVGLLGWAGNAVWVAVQASLSDEPSGRPARETVLAVNLVRVEPGVAVPVLETFGEIRSRRTLELRASAEGRVMSLSDTFQNGGRVAAGDLLLQLDPAEAEAALATARADLAEAEADRRDAITGAGLAADDLAVAREQADLRAQALTRQTDLLERGVGSATAVETAALAAAQERASVVSRRQALAQAEARVEQADAGIERARIARAEAERLLADTELRAGFDGVLSDVAVVAGGLVGRNEALARLVDPDALEVAFRLSTSQYARLLDDGRLRPSPVEVSGGSGLIATGRIDRESPTVADGETGRLVYARLDGTAGLRPGDIVTVRVAEPALDNVAILPALAVDAAGTVLRPDADMRLVEVAVEVARRQGDSVLVRAPDLAGADIVAERTPALGAGIRIRPLGQAEREAPRAASTGPGTGEVMLTLTEDRRARLVGFLESGGGGMSDRDRARLLALLAQDQVPAEAVKRLEDRMGS
jgi:RND family efflux transporter MFP subunit